MASVLAVLAALVVCSAQANNLLPSTVSASSWPALDSIGELQGRSLQQRTVQCKTICKGQPVFPVCTGLGPGAVSYASACIAICSGKTIAYWGICVAAPCLCPPLFAPVCGGGKTYLNSCFATCAGVKSSSPGVCSADCTCPSTNAPVCGLDNKQYTNECKAACAGTAPQYSGTCDSRIGACKCTNTIDPICVTKHNLVKVITGNVTRTPYNQTYQNACLAKCDGADLATARKGTCPDFARYHWRAWWCDCPLTLDPVCAQAGIGGGLVTMVNKCTAKCLKYTVVSQGVCTSNCLCPMKVKPVCANGKTYRTACDARCKGKATTWKDGPCTACSACPKASLMNPLTDYVCGDNGSSYANSCLAECEGVTVKSKGFCSTPSAGK